MDNTNICPMCNFKEFSSRSNLRRHIGMVHLGLTNSGLSFNKCLNGCNISFIYIKDLIEHLQLKHKEIGAIPETRTLCFPTLLEFSKWLVDIQAENNVYYIKGTSTNSNPDKAIMYYRCNQYVKQRTSTASKRGSNVKGSRKLTKVACTSFVTVHVDAHAIDKKVLVQYFPFHYGHEPESQPLNSNKVQGSQHVRLDAFMERIALKLSRGVSVSRILDDVRNEIDKGLVPAERANLLTRRDIQNLMVHLKLQPNRGKRDEDDAASIDMWTEECFFSENNPIILYKKPFSITLQLKLNDLSNLPFLLEDLCLVTMNDTQIELFRRFAPNLVCVETINGGENYNVDLTSVLVLDESGDAFPCAFMWSNRELSLKLDVFFAAIAEVAGKVRCRYFMGDLSQSSYKAWCRVMGTPDNHWLSAWHVEKDWRKYVVLIRGANPEDTKRQREDTLKTCKALQTMVGEEDFRDSLGEFLGQLEANQSTDLFLDYFLWQANASHMWAFCRRTEVLGVDHKMNTLAKYLGYEYQEGRKVERLDRAIHAVQQCLKDMEFERLIKLTKSNSDTGGSFTERHENALNAKFQVTFSPHNKFEVADEEFREIYSVERLLETPCCLLVCRSCEICVHSFSCSCFDYLATMTICEHIHCVTICQIVLQESVEGESTDVAPEWSGCNSLILTLDNTPEPEGEAEPY